MSEASREILKQALSLKESDRVELAGALIESLEGAGAEAAWEAEIKRRLAVLDSKSVETVPWSKVRERLLRGFD